MYRASLVTDKRSTDSSYRKHYNNYSKSKKHINLIYLHICTGPHKTIINIVQTVVTVKGIIITINQTNT
jgi:hypothetical protein